MLGALKEEVCAANVDLPKRGLVTHTWGNVSARSHDDNLVAIKPSGVPYESLRPDDIVVLDLNGAVVEGTLNPSSDTPTHLFLYQAFQRAGGITHTHSAAATAFAQARREIRCYGTTHADCFAGPVPVTRPLTDAEIGSGYERNTGLVIAECFEHRDPVSTPAALVAGHAPFCWAASALASVDVAESLEAVARMAIDTRLIAPDAPELEPSIRRKHFERKHGASATYGQREHA
ncbi:MAG: L-ribulose-5-phosphate 4-epimerase AraD [Planctomycetota bacterium]